ncbi:hypothetical protein BT96DRAFT_926125 [Gymnopus androsaceus JB14]|uniref:Small RNA 2'-O-methyltransferase n=1 Tax=Gymnopus androsaceus JB14 TaxID=1447944 RepID=A0A6A4GYL2_9AGAR|nr:hypothetical protein BT96DRAFT_926125 [Gymnopus androsaceus JB14]
MAPKELGLTFDASSDEGKELNVTFFPPLFLQRRIWILNVLRQESIIEVLDAGCGEGTLLSVLSVPSQWLEAPPQSLLYPNGRPSLDSASPINLFNSSSDPIPNLHITRIAGLDISSYDLKFAVDATAPPSAQDESLMDPWRLNKREGLRWEEMTAKIWQGGLETINEEFVGIECIVSTEVIEHLPPPILPFFAPVLLGVYRPKFLLITTPSYTFNARFTSPESHPSLRLRTGYADPTGRTDRIFRHHDHKFEWTPQEFREYCEKEAKEWGYSVEIGDIGRAQEVDEWGRDAELGGASLVAKFTRVDDERRYDRDDIEKRARSLVKTLSEEQSTSSPAETETDPAPASTTEHRLLVSHHHPAHECSQSPLSLQEIGDVVKSRMEGLRESFLRIEELWYDPEVSKACGGWIELLVRAVEEYDSTLLTLIRDAESPLSPGSEMNIQRHRDLWKVGLVGATTNPHPLWPTTEIIEEENDKSIEFLPSNWNPDVEYKSEYGDYSDDGAREVEIDYGQTAPSSSGEWEEEISYSTGEEGDVSWGEDDSGDVGANTSFAGGWGSWRDNMGSQSQWGEVKSGWGEKEEDRGKRRRSASVPALTSSSSTTGWDGDKSEDTSTS